MTFSLPRAILIALVSIAAISAVSILAAVAALALLAKPIPGAPELLLLYLVEHLPGLIILLFAVVFVIRRGVRPGIWWAAYGASLIINPVLWLLADPLVPETLQIGPLALLPPSDKSLLIWGTFTAVISRHVAHRLLPHLIPKQKAIP